MSRSRRALLGLARRLGIPSTTPAHLPALTSDGGLLRCAGRAMLSEIRRHCVGPATLPEILRPRELPVTLPEMPRPQEPRASFPGTIRRRKCNIMAASPHLPRSPTMARETHPQQPRFRTMPLIKIIPPHDHQVTWHGMLLLHGPPVLTGRRRPLRHTGRTGRPSPASTHTT